MAFETDAVAQGCQGGTVKRLGAGHIGDAKCHMVKHEGLLKLLIVQNGTPLMYT
jgi:hypothetical protein